MKKSIIFKGLFVVLFLLNLVGCSFIAADNANDVVVHMKKKYGIEVEVTHVSHNNGNYTYFLTDLEKGTRFTATTDKKGNILSDNLIPALMSDKVEELIKEEFKASGIEAEVHTYMMGTNSSDETNTDITLEEYVKSYKPKYLSSQILLKENPNITNEKIESVYNAIYKALLETTYQAKITIATDPLYEELAKSLNFNGKINQGVLYDHKQNFRELKAYIDQDGFHTLEGAEN